MKKTWNYITITSLNIHSKILKKKLLKSVIVTSQKSTANPSACACLTEQCTDAAYSDRIIGHATKVTLESLNI